jgi:stringent starvation protein B
VKMMSVPLPPKKEVALALLERSSVYVHLDPRHGPVVVPACFKKQPQLVLQVGLNMPVPIKDLQVDDDAMSCTLSFSRSPFFCVVQWSSVFAIIGCDDGRGMVWPDDVPAEVARQTDSREPGLPARDGAKPLPLAPLVQSPAEAPKAKRPRKRPALAAAPDAEAREGSTGAPSRPAKGGGQSRPAVAPTPIVRSPSPPRRKRELPPYLRVVK